MLPSACRSPTSTVPQRGSLRPLCRERRAKRCPPGNRVGRGSYRAPVVGDAPRHQPRVNARRTRSARTAIPLRGMVAKAVELSAVPSAIRPRSAAFNRMVRSGFCYTDFCWRDGGIPAPVRASTTSIKICKICLRFGAGVSARCVCRGYLWFFCTYNAKNMNFSLRVYKKCVNLHRNYQ